MPCLCKSNTSGAGGHVACAWAARESVSVSILLLWICPSTLLYVSLVSLVCISCNHQTWCGNSDTTMMPLMPQARARDNSHEHSHAPHTSRAACHCEYAWQRHQVWPLTLAVVAVRGALLQSSMILCIVFLGLPE